VNLRVSWVASPFAALAVALIVLLGATEAFAQQGAGVLTGTVTDAQDRKPLADVVVTATSPDLQGEQVVLTDASGLYRLPDLPSGMYSVRFEKDLYKAYARDGISLRADATLRVNAELLPTVIPGDEVPVIPKAPIIDEGNSGLTSTIGKDFMSRLPLSAPTSKGGVTRDIESVAETVPGAKADSFGVSVAGASSPENKYMVDGLNVGNPGYGTIGTSLSTEFVKEVDVLTGGYMPEYGRTTGGTISAVTKSGSNDFHGGAFGYWAPGALAGTPATPPSGLNAFTLTTPLAWQGDVGADVGGPIIKDKLWFYTGVDVSSENYDVNKYYYRVVPTAQNLALVASGYNSNCNLPGQPACPQTQQIGSQSNRAGVQSLQALAKLTWAINENNKLTGTFIASPNHTGGNGSFSVDPMSGGVQLNGYPSGTLASTAVQALSTSYDTSLRWSTEFDNKRVLVDTMVGWHHQEDSDYPADGSQFGNPNPAAAINQPNVSWTRSTPGYHPITDFENSPLLASQCAAPAGSGVNTLCPVTTPYSTGGPIGLNSHLYTQQYDRYTVGSTLTYLLQAAGHHLIKAGFDVELTTVSQVNGHPGSAFLAESSDGTSFSTNEGFGVLVGPDNASPADPLRVHTKALIAGGFIQDSWTIFDVVTANFGVRYDVQQLYNNAGQLAMSLPNQWSPRAGVIYDPTQNGRAKLFASYARYYENVPLALANDALVGTPNILPQYSNPGSGSASPPCQSVASSASCTSLPKNPHQLGAWSPSQVYSTLSAGLDPIDPNTMPTTEDDFVTGGEYQIIADARLGVSWQHRWLVRWLDDMSNDLTQTFFLGNPGTGWASNFPKASRDYDAVTLYFMKSFGDNWLTSANYTISSLRGNVAGTFLSNSGSATEFDPNHNASFDTRAFTINQYGPLPGDRTHEIKLFGARDWTLTAHNHVSTGLSFRATSGTPTNYFGGDSIYGPGAINLLVPRGSGPRTPWIYDVDANVGYRFALDENRSFTLSVDVFNLLSLQGITSVNEQYTSASSIGQQNGTLTQARVQDPNTGLFRPIQPSDRQPTFGLPSAYQSPRYFRFGIRGTF
jgi:hypothetical protein